MRTVKHPDLTEKNHRNPAAFALTDLSTKLGKECFDIAPLDVGAHGTSKNCLESFPVLSFHIVMVPYSGTTESVQSVAMFLMNDG